MKIQWNNGWLIVGVLSQLMNINFFLYNIKRGSDQTVVIIIIVIWEMHSHGFKKKTHNKMVFKKSFFPLALISADISHMHSLQEGSMTTQDIHSKTEFATIKIMLNTLFCNLHLHYVDRKDLAHPLFNSFLKDFIYLFIERREGKERGRKISMCGCLGTWPTTQACAMTGNLTGDPLVCKPLSYPAYY